MLNPDRQLSGTLASAEADAARSVAALALVVLALAAATILAALGFEHIGGYQPCALCLQQRVPYYIGVPLAVLAALAIFMRAPHWLAALFFALFVVTMLIGTGLGAYHAGVEWALWEGPAACAPSVSVGGAGDMLDQLENTRPPSCTEASWRLLGLSFAGWNVLVSALLAGLGACGAVASLRRSARAAERFADAPR